jgi:hypothetical protein
MSALCCLLMRTLSAVIALSFVSASRTSGRTRLATILRNLWDYCGVLARVILNYRFCRVVSTGTLRTSVPGEKSVRRDQSELTPVMRLLNS